MYQFGNDLSLEKWADPYDSDLLKFVTVLIYLVNVLASVIMVAFVVYETRGTQPDLILFFFQITIGMAPGVPGVLKNPPKLLSSCAKIQPKLSKLGKTIKNCQKSMLSYSFFSNSIQFGLHI